MLYNDLKNFKIVSWQKEFKFLFLPNVIFPLIIETSFPESAIAAIGIPQFATGPQKCVLRKGGTKNHWWKKA